MSYLHVSSLFSKSGVRITRALSPLLLAALLFVPVRPMRLTRLPGRRHRLRPFR